MYGRSVRVAVVALVVLLAQSAPRTQVALGTAFTYQGRLTDASTPASGSYDLQFTLFDAATGGAAVGSAVTLSSVAVANGLFIVGLDFGASAFAGSKRWVAIGVRPAGSSGAFTVLSPRQELTPSPNALYAANAATIGGLACATNQIPKWSGTVWTCAADVDTDTNSGGTVTGVTAGAGLSGGTITTSGTIAVATGGVTSAMIANSAVGSAQVNTAQVQARVSSACAVGQTIQQINADGTVVCQTMGGLSCAVNQFPKWSGTAWVCSGSTPLMIGGGAAVNQTTVYPPMFGSPGLTTNEDAVRVPVAVSGTLANLRVQYRFAAGVGQSITVTVRRNLVDTVVNCTVSDLTDSCSDLVSSVSFAAADIVTVRVAPTAGSTNNNWVWWSATYTQ